MQLRIRCYLVLPFNLFGEDLYSSGYILSRNVRWLVLQFLLAALRKKSLCDGVFVGVTELTDGPGICGSRVKSSFCGKSRFRLGAAGTRCG